MQITEVRIHPANEELVKAYASICFDDCFVVYDIKVIQGPTGLFLSFLPGGYFNRFGFYCRSRRRR